MNRDVARRLRLLEPQILTQRAWDYSGLSNEDVDLMVDVYFRCGRREAVSEEERAGFGRLESLIFKHGPGPTRHLSDEEVDAEIAMHEQAWLERRGPAGVDVIRNA